MKVIVHADAGLPAAVAFTKKHVIVSKRDLSRIKALAKKLGFYDELKALDVKMQEIKIR